MGWARPETTAKYVSSADAASGGAAASVAAAETLRLQRILDAARARGMTAASSKEPARLQKLLGTVVSTGIAAALPMSLHHDSRLPTFCSAGVSSFSDESFEVIDRTSISSSSILGSSWSDVVQCSSGSDSSSLEKGVDNTERCRRHDEDGNDAQKRQRAGKRSSGRTRQRAAKWRKEKEVRVRTPSPDFYHISIKEHIQCNGASGWLPCGHAPAGHLYHTFH
eukprot:gb/GFBE01061334.1/.p1 GENE.gb/GFBE01061334.1/~~gb/GFBE01061334.1/.p1  ORF type:complete len:223 (+),score=36.02 gb/GFBE01061334.1/:1-669(+)